MALQENEILPGVVAYFDSAILNDDPEVRVSGDPVSRVGAGSQFVCYKVAGDESFWTPLTATARPERTRVKLEWVVSGYGPLRAGDVYLQDGKNTYAGPNRSFVEASRGELPFVNSRPRISEEGIVEFVRIVRQRGGQV